MLARLAETLWIVERLVVISTLLERKRAVIGAITGGLEGGSRRLLVGIGCYHLGVPAQKL